MYKDDFDNLNIKDTVLDLIDKNEHKNKINSINLAGDHNRENAYLILTELENMGIQTDKAQLAIDPFPGPGRRFEQIADNW